MGLLQPIGIDHYHRLIFAGGRLRACRDILEWRDIPCAVLDIDSLVAGEYAENEFRKDFTPSERATIGEAVEEELGAKERRGNPQLAAIAANSEKGKTADIAAKHAGFKARKPSSAPRL